ncbi:MAG TPA: RidA family protein [Candidatus Methylomirabilis sp.]|nr:RidA family protein [Candidatus Methylomirabilis sp.]
MPIARRVLAGMVGKGLAPHIQFGEGHVKKKVVYVMDVAAMGMPGSRGRRVECYRLGNWVCMTGQASFRLDTGEMVGIGDPAAQARQSCENVKALMERAGGSMADVVKLTVYLTDRAYREVTYPILRGYFAEPRPCQTGVIVKGLAREEMLIELDAWGFIDDPD